jgi:Domain of unknown function (DUF4939)/Zinc knuckle
MNVDNASQRIPSKPTELKLRPPNSFAGKREELDDFLQDALLYLSVNDELYDTDKKKIAYVLSFMNESDAKSWKGQFLQKASTATGINLGTWTAFLTDLKAAFSPYDAPGDALEELIALKQGTNSIEDHIARFKVLLTKSQVPETSPSSIDYFRKTLNVPLQRKLLELATPPTSLQEWYDWATKLDNNYRRLQRILGRAPGKGDNKGKEETKRKWTFQKRERDPNAMDIDAMTVEQREQMMRKGQCFKCGQVGHMAREQKCGQTGPGVREYRTPNLNPATSTSSAPPVALLKKKMTAKELTTHIRSLTALLNEKEKEEFYDEAEKEGF